MSKKLDLKLPPLIAIFGANGVGKTTTARCLQAAYDYQVRSFAAPIKTYLASLGLPRAALFGDSEQKLELLPEFGYRTGCGLMIDIATATREHLGDDVFARALLAELARDKPERVVIDDLRFDDEYKLVREAGGVVWLVVREPGGAAGAWVDRVIVNDGDVPRLFDRVREALGQ